MRKGLIFSGGGMTQRQMLAIAERADEDDSRPEFQLLARHLNALLRRFNKKNSTNSSHIIDVADLHINTEQFIVQKKGADTKITLAKKEFELLCLLASKPGKVFTREEIFNKIWGSNVIVGNRTIDVHIRKIREKVGEVYIKTIKGIGYKFEF